MTQDEKQMRAVAFGVALGLIAIRRPVCDGAGTIDADVKREARAIVNAVIEEAKLLDALL